MTVILFQDRFAAAVVDGTKRSTIRLPRKRPIKVGDRLSLRKWSGAPYRSKQIVLRKSVCSRVATITIDDSHGRFVFVVDGVTLHQDEWAKLARLDGFACTTDLLDWFHKTHGLPFSGVLIQWEDSQ